MLDTLKLGFIGGGNMAAALIGGLIAKGAHGANIVVVDPTEYIGPYTRRTNLGRPHRRCPRRRTGRPRRDRPGRQAAADA